MSQHPSLKSSKFGKKRRTVWKRYERYSSLKEKDILKEGDSVFGMPKLKIARVKLKKEKAEKPEEAAVGVGAATEAKTEVQKAPAPKPKAEKEKKEKK